MIESNIKGIFPIPIYTSELNRELTSKEFSFVKKNGFNCTKNEGNITSKDTFVLNKNEFKNLKKELDTRVRDYFDKIICPANKITPYITQSWLNYTEKNQYHHKHEHPNSLVSGVFYINSDENFDKIFFFKKDSYQMIKPEIKDWNVWNSESWWFSVKTGDIILFPSSLTHMVEAKEGTNTRISLAFNVFIKGSLGKEISLSSLTL
jgi:uncharacterized protein (TIGR02466 family)